MFGFGTILNVVGILIGGILGHFFGSLLKKNHLEAMALTCGVSVIFIGIAGAMEKMLTINDGVISSGQAMFVVVCLTLGGLIGEIIDIDKGFFKFGEFIKNKSGNSSDSTFVDAFVTASLTVSIGAMAIVGSIEDGLLGDWTILGTKAILDTVMIMVMTSSLGKGAIFSAIPVFIFQYSLTILSKGLQNIMTPLAMNNLSLIGSILIVCIGLNIIRDRNIKVANLLPSLLLAVLASFINF